MKNPSLGDLSRRERQIMDVVYAADRPSAAEIQSKLADPPSYSAVRALLRVLVEKGYLETVKDGARLLYVPVVKPEEARESALDNVVSTFFNGSAAQAMLALLDLKADRLSSGELDELASLIDKARQEGR